ncbi:MAG: biosynthetic arginine decarboxylase [Bdellovibrionales bacterium]|nr:biosynthetic arginine decarboxylase [Bdellovibrionales bacterium]
MASNLAGQEIEPMEGWSIDKTRDLYNVLNWGDGYFDINAQGNLVVRPRREGVELDLYEFTSSLVSRGIEAPILFRFNGIIKNRIERLYGAFQLAIDEYNYPGRYGAVFPIKVNQQAHVVDAVREAGKDFRIGLEVGSKPELVAVLAIHDTPEAPLLCNGYKDRDYIELALLATKLGRQSIVIIEQLNEIPLLLSVAEKMGIEANVGIRIKPSLKGSGHWESSSGDFAKFGLSTREVISALEQLETAGKSDWVKLLHYHVGSQITSIRAIKKVLNEATRMYTEIKKRCPALSFIDVGGGLAVDYDGSKTNFKASMNYTVEEYARDIVYEVGQACTEAGVECPTILSESGRALVAHHSLLITEVVDVAPTVEAAVELPEPPSDHQILKDFVYLFRDVKAKNAQETLNDALSLREQALQSFVQGDISLEERGFADTAFWHLLAKIKKASSELAYLPEELEELDNRLTDLYFCSFSVFQSIPDSWAIGQLFPVMPIQRLNEEPKRRATLADMSCDSDGKIDKFVDLRDIKRYVPVHAIDTSKRYFLGVFLVGAYQEILGDLHNLFGDTNVVHAEIGDDGEVEVHNVIEGDTVREVLSYVQYDPPMLVEKLRQSMERAMKEGRLTNEESAHLQRRYKQALDGYTYYQNE